MNIFRILYVIYILPALIVHEILHIVTCLVTNVKITGIRFRIYNTGLQIAVSHKFSTSFTKTAIIALSPILQVFILITVYLFTNVSVYLLVYIATELLIARLLNVRSVFEPSDGDLKSVTDHSKRCAERLEIEDLLNCN
jgi:hypothetical protein